MAPSIQADATKAQVLFAWIILKDQADYPGIFVTWLLEGVPQRLRAFLVEQDMVVVEDERIAIHPPFADVLTPLLAQADANAGQVQGNRVKASMVELNA